MSRIYLFLITVALMFLTYSCKTDDVEPYVSLTASNLTIAEADGQSKISASIVQPADKDIVVQLKVGGTASGDGVDYTLSDKVIRIVAGELSGEVLLTSVADVAEEENETVDVEIESIVGGVSVDNQALTITIEDAGAPVVINIIMNEVLYDPSNNGLDGDANGDGQYAQNEDEFIEFVNLTTKSVDMSGYKIYDSSGLTANVPNHVFPDNTIVPSGGCIVVFGGGTPTGTFGGAIVQKSTSGDFNMDNAGDIMTLKDKDGKVMVSFDIEPFSNNPNESYTRFPDLTGDFVQHRSASASRLFSPGTKIDGTRFLP